LSAINIYIRCIGYSVEIECPVGGFGIVEGIGTVEVEFNQGDAAGIIYSNLRQCTTDGYAAASAFLVHLFDQHDAVGGERQI
jgi:hypothetical protein